VDYRQRTLKREIGCTGIGLHSGEKVSMNLRPAPPNTGINFVRTDFNTQPMIRAKFDYVIDTMLATTIGQNGSRVSTIEHLMAAFFGLGIDNAIVELNGPEVPIMDGSAAPFVFLMKSAGIREQKEPKRFVVIKKPFEVHDGNKSVCIFPAKQLEISYMIDFQHPLLRNQEYGLTFSGKDFVKEISKARTFGFLKDVETLKNNGFAKGGSLDNAIVMDEFRILNEDGLRFKNEFVRHKILDFIGDLAIIGSPIIGHFVVKRSGHFLNQSMLKQLMQSNGYWEALTFKTPEECSQNGVRIPAFGVFDLAPA
jgi:UDP-3-O-[3-hydroxymyristoyl] N-acetylglucosamine deacetylase